MPATTGKNVLAVLNTNAMNIEDAPDSLKEYAKKMESENTIDITEMFMAIARSLKAIEDRNKLPWWKRLFS